MAKPHRKWMPGSVVFYPSIADVTVALRYAVRLQTPTERCLPTPIRVVDTVDLIIEQMMYGDME